MKQKIYRDWLDIDKRYEKNVKKEIVQELISYGAVKVSDKCDIPIKQGRFTNIYFNLKLLAGIPETLEKILKLIKIPSDVDYIAVGGMGGMIIGEALSLHTKLPLVFDRGNPKKHGAAKSFRLDGANLDKPKIPRPKIWKVDDVISVGTSLTETEEGLRSEIVYYDVVEIFVIINRTVPFRNYHIDKRGNKLLIRHLFTLEDFGIDEIRVTDEEEY
jgi:orotate phosphoribosyltransferase